MFPVSEMPSTTSMLSAYTTFAASAMLIRTQVQNASNQLVPKDLRDKIMSKLGILTGNLSSSVCIVINETTNGYLDNEVFEAAQLYLRTMINPSIKQLKVSKTLSVTADKEEIILDNFNGILLQWKLACGETQKNSINGVPERVEQQIIIVVIAPKTPLSGKYPLLLTIVVDLNNRC